MSLQDSTSAVLAASAPGIGDLVLFSCAHSSCIAFSWSGRTVASFLSWRPLFLLFLLLPIIIILIIILILLLLLLLLL